MGKCGGAKPGAAAGPIGGGTTEVMNPRVSGGGDSGGPWVEKAEGAPLP